MMTSNPEESRKIAEKMMELIGEKNLPEEMEEPGKNGPPLDSLIPDRNPPKRPK